MNGARDLTIDTLRVSVIDRCNLRCTYCMPPEGVPLCSHEDIMRFEEIATVVRFLKARYELRAVRLTGGEPLLRRDLTVLVRLLADIRVEDLALTTNAQTLAEMAPQLKKAGLQRVNVSLNTLDPDRYARLTRGGSIEPVFDGIRAAFDAGLAPVRLNVVILRGENDDEVTDLVRFAFERNCEIRFIELMPLGAAQSLHERCFASNDEARREISKSFDLDPLPHPPGTPSRRWRARNSEGLGGVVGFISPETEPFCDGCRRMRLTAQGRLVGCLVRDEGQSILPLLRSGERLDDRALAEAVRRAFARKEGPGLVARGRSMVTLGG